MKGTTTIGVGALTSAVTLGALLVPLNSTMIAVALPDLITDFDSEVGTASWLVTAYLIAMVVLQPLVGRLGDRLGRERLVVTGLCGFLAASIGATVAPDLATLIGFRVLQAAGGALVIPNGLALIREGTAAEDLGSRLGVIGSVLPFGAAVGPPLAGFLLAAWGWRTIFLVNVPVAALAIALTIAAPKPARQASTTPHRQAGLPSLPPALLAAGAAIALSNLAMYVTMLSIPLLLVRRAGTGSGEVGLVLACLSVTTAAVSPLGGRLSDRMGRRRPAVAGGIVTALGLVGLGIDPAMDTAAAAVALLLAGAGIGLATPALQTAAIESVDVAHAGAAAGLAATSRYVGSIAGSLLLSTLLDPGTTHDGDFGLLYAAVAGTAAASAAVALLVPGRCQTVAPSGVDPAESRFQELSLALEERS